MKSLPALSARWLPLLAAVALLQACQKPLHVETGQAVLRDILSSVSVTGTIEPETTVPVAPDISGEVIRIGVDEGEKVGRGDLLFEIRPDNYQAAVAQAEANRNTARADMANAQSALTQARAQLMQDSLENDRNQGLLAQGAITQQQAQQAKLKLELTRSAVASAAQQVQAAFYRIKASEATLARASDDLNRTRVYSSMAGTVTMMNMQVGQRVVGTGMMSGTEVIRIADLGRMMVKVEVNENDIVQISLGDTASIEVDAFPGKKFRGEVTEIGYSPTSSNGTVAAAAASAVDQVTNYPIKVLILPESYERDPEVMARVPAHGSPFRPGMSAVVRIFTDRADDVVAVPIQSVTLAQASENAPQAQARDRIVYTYDSTTHIVHTQKVETGLSDDDYIQIKTGLKRGALLITGPFNAINERLRDGMEVQVAPPGERPGAKIAASAPPQE